MKKLLVCVAMITLCSSLMFAAQQTWTGKISDGMCGSDHAMMQNGPKKMSDKDCVNACVKSGQKYVLVSGGKVYQIRNQGFAGLATNAGAIVTITGDAAADGKSIAVSGIEAARR